MVQKISQVGKTTIEYFVHGVDPKLLIQSGIHGDEHEVIDAVRSAVEKYKDLLPDFVLLPTASPSAVANQTRLNTSGVDLNRAFVDGTQEEEVLANQAILKQFHFDLIVSFHEDVEYSLFYLYDSGILQDSECWERAKHAIRRQGVSLLTGVDDPMDPVLGYEFVDGYGLSVFDGADYDGSFEHWALREGITKHWIMPEVPTSLKRSKKAKIVESIFEHLVLPQFQVQQESQLESVDAGAFVTV